MIIRRVAILFEMAFNAMLIRILRIAVIFPTENFPPGGRKLVICGGVGCLQKQVGSVEGSTV